MTIQMKIARACMIGSLALAASVLAPADAISAAGPPKQAALPTSVTPPPAGKGAPRNAATVDLKAAGYVEEEFLVSGKANVYEYDPTGAVVVKTPNVDYTTRILVRRPADPKKFSGTVRFETSHPQYGFDFVWGRSSDFVLANGDAMVSVAMRRSPNSGIDGLKRSDPVRYASINFTEDGLNWDIIGQVGRLLKTKTAANPLNGYDVKRTIAQGWSGGGAVLLIYISDGFHKQTRMPNGRPIIDGYMVGEPSGYPKINSTAASVAADSPRQKVQALDVPAISLNTRPQEPGRRRADGDQRNDRYRVYEIAGASHNNRLLPKIDKQAPGELGRSSCVHELSYFPMHYYFKSTLARLDAWVAKGVTPPPSQRMALKADGRPVVDEHGSPVGGVRSTNLDVPVASFIPNMPVPGGSTACGQDGGQERFSADKFTALYKTPAEYAKKVSERADELVRDGWLLAADAEDVRKEAAKFGTAGRQQDEAN